jgi:hypothetical protein
MTSSLSRRFRRADSADEDEVTGRLWGSHSRRADGPAFVLQQDHADTVTFPIYAAEGWPARINVRRHPQPCAYHQNTATPTMILYANMPFDATNPLCHGLCRRLQSVLIAPDRVFELTDATA